MEGERIAMTLDEAIKRCEEHSMDFESNRDYRNEQRQLAQWLSELKMRRERRLGYSGVV